MAKANKKKKDQQSAVLCFYKERLKNLKPFSKIISHDTILSIIVWIEPPLP